MSEAGDSGDGKPVLKGLAALDIVGVDAGFCEAGICVVPLSGTDAHSPAGSGQVSHPPAPLTPGQTSEGPDK